MITINNLSNVTYEQLFDAFKEAFREYEIQLNYSEFVTMINRRGYDPGLSFAAFNNSSIVAFTLNGIGWFNNIKTAYDTGTGTVEEFRGKGLATKIFEHSIPYLKEAGIEQYLLEVLQHNSGAISVYKKLGFEVTREFNYFVQDCANINLYNKAVPDNLSIKPCAIGTVMSCPEFCDFTPSWQNNFDAINRDTDSFMVNGAYLDDTLVGYSVFEPISGDITQIAVSSNKRRSGIGSALLSEIIKANKHTGIKLINSDVSSESVSEFMHKNGIELSGKQFEMIKTL
jgi:ribosomal protein S18 acetylase RimI-like enzyme